VGIGIPLVQIDWTYEALWDLRPLERPIPSKQIDDQPVDLNFSASRPRTAAVADLSKSRWALVAF